MALFERRQYERFDFQKELIIDALGPMDKKSIQYYAKTINISQGGMLIHTIANFREKTRCQIRFKGNNLKRLEKEATILRQVTENIPEYVSEKEKVYALEFQNAYTQEEVQAILKPPSAV